MSEMQVGKRIIINGYGYGGLLPIIVAVIAIALHRFGVIEWYDKKVISVLMFGGLFFFSFAVYLSIYWRIKESANKNKQV